MKRGHGDADLLIAEEHLDLSAFDALVASGGDDPEAARLVGRNNFLGPNRFGKMFPDLEPFRPSDEALDELGRAMRELSPQDPALNNSDIPAGVTYLGQFIDHDITRDPTEGFPPIDDPDEIRQARTPTLDLDSLYGLGPRRQRELYEDRLRPGRARFKIGRTSSVATSGGTGVPEIPGLMPNDLPRRPDKSAIIGDDRNDENTIVAQTHLAFLKFHNRVMDRSPRDGDDRDESARFNQAEEDHGRTSFHKARRLVRWHYQWLVLHDFLPKLVDPDVLDDVRTNGRRFYRFEEEPFDGRPFMPLEFSVAAYRLGHSMVREIYDFNRVFNTGGPPALTPATFRLLFAFTGGGGFLPPNTHVALPSNWIIDWRRFFDVGRPDLLNFTRKIDTKIAPQLQSLPPAVAAAPPVSLPVRNLLRASRVGLPTAQDVAEAMEVQPLSPDEIAGGDDGPKLREHGFHERTPLWYYILKEAERQGGGNQLGEIGSRIVSEVFVGLLEGDENSFLSKKPDWRPTLPAATKGTFGMADLLRLVGELNPIGPGPEGP